MKKILTIVLTIIIVSCLAVSFAACKGKFATLNDMIDLSKIDYKSMDIAENLDSVEVFNQALEYMSKCENFAYTVLFNFATSPAVATQSNKEVVRKNGDKLLHEQVTIGTGLGESHLAVLRLHKQDSHKVVKNDVSNKKDAKSRVPGFDYKDDKKIFDYNLQGIAPVDMHGNVPDYEHCKQFNSYADYMYYRASAYIWFYNYDKDDLAEEHDNNVYIDNGKYYCDITIDTKNCLKNGNQPDVVKDIEQGVNMKITAFEKNTVLRLQLEKVDNTYRFVATNLEESYKASMAKANQTYQRVFSYDSKYYEITDQHIKLFN